MDTFLKWLAIVISSIALGAVPLMVQPATPDITAGDEHACAISLSGVAKCWGNNYWGQLGDGTTQSRPVPVNVVGLDSATVAISAGRAHTCAVTAGGAAKCWGWNLYGQLGDGTTTRRYTAVDVVGLSTGVVAISAGEEHTCALTTTGAVKCWGSNRYGMLGNRSPVDSHVPVDVYGLSSGVAEIAASQGSSCALTNTGRVLCWGFHHIDPTQCYPMPGMPTNCFLLPCPPVYYCEGIARYIDYPDVVPGMEGGFSSIAMPLVAVSNFPLCGVRNDGGLICSGIFSSGCTAVPVPSAGVRAAAMGLRHSCVLGRDGVVSCWGENYYGEIGRSSGGQSVPLPALVEGLPPDVSKITAGSWFSCAIAARGDAYCWGRNAYGQLGNGETYQGINARPTAVVGFSTESSVPNYTGLWWNAAESGWGINLAQQGDILFATLFTYDSTRQPLWLVMSNGVLQANRSTFSGTLYRTTGPAFDANPFTPIGPQNLAAVGTMTVSFPSANAGTLRYTVNGIEVATEIQRQVYGSRAATCFPTSGSRAGLTNYQDIWWNPAESGWGVNVTHQDNTLFATLFTYDRTGRGLWLVMSAGRRQADGSYLGDLYQAQGPAFNANPFTPLGPRDLTTVGTMRFRFADGEHGTLTYTYKGTEVTKQITRQVFSSPVPYCN